ncbi:hypothetical protein HT594_00002 [Phenacoccus solenopsis nudivirus]|nr:hypothetical protein HT594_00002 [Phenacoccus solenopsis nudivirus]
MKFSLIYAINDNHDVTRLVERNFFNNGTKSRMLREKGNVIDVYANNSRELFSDSEEE